MFIFANTTVQKLIHLCILGWPELPAEAAWRHHADPLHRHWWQQAQRARPQGGPRPRDGGLKKRGPRIRNLSLKRACLSHLPVSPGGEGSRVFHIWLLGTRNVVLSSSLLVVSFLSSIIALQELSLKFRVLTFEQFVFVNLKKPLSVLDRLSSFDLVMNCSIFSSFQLFCRWKVWCWLLLVIGTRNNCKHFCILF